MEMQFPVILDGATGTELQKRGFTGGGCAEAWVLEHPEAMLEKHGSRAILRPRAAF